MSKAGLAVVCVTTAVVTGAVWYQQASKSAHEDGRRQMNQFETEHRRYVRAVNDEITRLQARQIGLHFGKAAGAEFELCRRYPPKLETNRAKCDMYEKYLADEAKKDQEHSTW
jgi:hypothetical protein